MPDHAKMLAGQCLCGSVAYQVEDAFEYAMMCHCSQCRRTTGSVFKPMGGITTAKIRLTRGVGDVLSFGKADAADIHCGLCGSLLYSIVRDGQYTHVTFGTLMDAPSRLPDHHIFAADKAPWFTITDGLPQWAGYAGISERIA